jgi:hypothetical protein
VEETKRLAELAIEIPAAYRALEAAEQEPKPASVDGHGLRAVEAFFAEIDGCRAKLKQLQRERYDLESRAR